MMPEPRPSTRARGGAGQGRGGVRTRPDLGRLRYGLGPVGAVAEVGREGGGDRRYDRMARRDQPELAVLVERGIGEVLRPDEHLRVLRAVVGLDDLPVDVEAAGGVVVTDAHPGPGEP